MTHAEEIATIRQNHREDLKSIFKEIQSVNKSVTQIETEMEHMVSKESIIPLIADATKKEFALHAIECDNRRNSKHGGQKNDWFKIAKNAAYLAAISGGGVGGGVGAYLAWLS
jgi:hypothetical protein